MTSQQRKKHLDRIFHTQSITTSSLDPPSVESSLPSSSPQLSSALSVDVQEFASNVTIPLACLQGIWTKATELLLNTGSTVPAPGHPTESRLVLSRSGKCPHLVIACKTGVFKCDSDCANLESVPTQLWLLI